MPYLVLWPSLCISSLLDQDVSLPVSGHSRLRKNRDWTSHTMSSTRLKFVPSGVSVFVVGNVMGTFACSR